MVRQSLPPHWLDWEINKLKEKRRERGGNGAGRRRRLVDSLPHQKKLMEAQSSTKGRELKKRSKEPENTFGSTSGPFEERGSSRNTNSRGHRGQRLIQRARRR
jgi:hypothetical protein